MLYVFYGNDEKSSRAKLKSAMESLSKRAPNAHTLRITDEDVDSASVQEILSSIGLFHPNKIVLFDCVLSNKQMRGDIFKYLKDIQKSKHVFFIIEKKILAAHEKKIEKHAEKMEKFDKSKTMEKRQNNFALSNAFKKGDRSNTWLEYRKALHFGAAPEALHGMLFWSMKDTIIRERFSGNENDLKKKAGELAEMPHKTRRDGVELEYALERFILNI